MSDMFQDDIEFVYDEITNLIDDVIGPELAPNKTDDEIQYLQSVINEVCKRIKSQKI